MTKSRKHFAYKQNVTNFAVKTHLTPSQRKLLNSGFLALGKQLPNVRGLNLLLVSNVLIDLSKQRVWLQNNANVKRFCRPVEKLTFH